jgi:hypothetical protein
MTRTTNLGLSLEPSVSKQPWIIFNELVNYLDAARLRTAYVAVTGTYAILEADCTVDCTANTFTITLPTAVGVAGQIYNLKNSGTGMITIATTTSQTIDDDASGDIILVTGENLQIQSDGANWMVI